MKMRCRLIVAALILLSATCALANLPYGTCIFYGQAQDQYGWPLYDDASVILRVGDRIIAQHEIDGNSVQGVNFSLRVPIDDGVGELYSEGAARVGDPVVITVVAFGREQNVIQTNIPPVGSPGDIIRINLTAGDDEDGDGLPDAWEHWIIDYDWLDDQTNVQTVLPGDDFDGDRMSNQDEFLAGTDPTWLADALLIEYVEVPALSGRVAVSFLSVHGKLYRVVGATDMKAGNFTPIGWAMNATDALRSDYIEGTGDWMTVYLEDTAERIYFYALRVTQP